MSVEAMKQALEALDHIHRTGDTQIFDMCYADEVIPALRQAIRQAERQEPIGSVADTDLQGFISDDYSHILVYPKGSYPEGGVDLYTAPQKHAWVSLSEKEVQAIFDMDLGVYESIEETMRRLEEINK